MGRWFLIMSLCFLASYIKISAQESNDEKIVSRIEKPYPRHIDCLYITFSKEENDLLNQKQKYISLPFKIRGDTITSLIDNFILNTPTKTLYEKGSVISTSRATRNDEYVRRFSPIEENISLFEIIEKINTDQDSTFIVMYLQEKEYETYLSNLRKAVLYFSKNSDYINGKVEKEICLNKNHAMVIPDDDRMFNKLIVAELAASSIAQQYNKIKNNEPDLIKAKNILADYYSANGDFETSEEYLVSQLRILSKCNYENKKDDQLILFKKISDISEKQGKHEMAKLLVDEDKDFSFERYNQIKECSFNSQRGNR